jgi:hypothetical protein
MTKRQQRRPPSLEVKTIQLAASATAPGANRPAFFPLGHSRRPALGAPSSRLSLDEWCGNMSPSHTQALHYCTVNVFNVELCPGQSLEGEDDLYSRWPMMMTTMTPCHRPHHQRRKNDHRTNNEKQRKRQHLLEAWMSQARDQREP